MVWHNSYTGFVDFSLSKSPYLSLLTNKQSTTIVNTSD